MAISEKELWMWILAIRVDAMGYIANPKKSFRKVPQSKIKENGIFPLTPIFL